MKLNTHDRTPRPKNSKLLAILWAVSAALICSMCGITIFAGFAYADTPAAGIFLILLYITMAIVVLIPFKDMAKAYIEIEENKIHVVDYYCGIKKEKYISFSDITSAEICIGCSHKVKGYRHSVAGMQYIIFKQNKKYLFKIIYLPETEEIFKQYLQ
jgi:hypothetical protein